MKILLPGGAGLVGQNLVAHLKRKGFTDLVVLDKHRANLEICRRFHPDIVVESSPNRWHGYWLTNDCPLDQFKHFQQLIAQKFAGDTAINDLPRVMRLPGFWHQKSEPFLTRMIFPKVALFTF